MRLIDADALKGKESYIMMTTLDTCFGSAKIFLTETIDNAPTVDAEPVVHCKDCIFRDKFGYCVAPMGEVGCARVDDDDFCSCGSRKKVEHDT